MLHLTIAEAVLRDVCWVELGRLFAQSLQDFDVSDIVAFF